MANLKVEWVKVKLACGCVLGMGSRAIADKESLKCPRHRAEATFERVVEDARQADSPR